MIEIKWSRFRQRLRRDWASRRLRQMIDSERPGLTRLGTAACGWAVPSPLIQPGNTAICVGVGEDMSFDVDLNRRGLKVYTLDPTPRSREHVTRVLHGAVAGGRVPINGSGISYDFRGFGSDRLVYLDIGLWNQDMAMRFYAPQDASHVSHSIVNLQRTDRWFEAQCLTLRTLSSRLQLGEIDILKLDVEGAEYAILKNIVDCGPRPKALCFEFDELRTPIDAHYMDRIYATIRMLEASGYQFRHIEASNTLFLRRD